MITAYGDLVKFVCEKYFGWNGKKDDYGRSLLQWVGTDKVRSVNPNFWVDFIINILSVFKDKWDYVLIPDCRFPNEIKRWSGDDWSITTVRINRIGFDSPLTHKQQNHLSETALDTYYFDYELSSESGLDKLEKEVDKFILWMEENN